MLGAYLFFNLESYHRDKSCSYLLSPQTSLMGGLGSPSARITLLGSKNLSDATKDPDALIFTEILEFAMSLAPISKGQEMPHTLSHLQAYRFIRAVSLAESGHVQLATRYAFQKLILIDLLMDCL